MATYKPIKGLEHYLIGDNGTIIRLAYCPYPEMKKGRKSYQERLLKTSVDKHGYVRADLCLNGVRKALKVHRLVATAFIPNPNNKPYINHKDGNKKNNNVNNLEWCSPSENNFHAFATGLKKPTNTFGIRNPKYKHGLCERVDEEKLCEHCNEK
jgi:hypothetical protein